MKKLLQQLYKSNPVIFEWAQSPIVYKTTDEWQKICSLFSEYVQTGSLLHHYRGMAKNNIRANFNGDEVVLKKYLYVLRPVLACDWILQKHSVPPTEFMKLVDGVLPVNLKPLVDKLLAEKMAMGEKEKDRRIEEIDSYIEKILNETEGLKFGKENNFWEDLNMIFFEITKAMSV